MKIANVAQAIATITTIMLVVGVSKDAEACSCAAYPGDPGEAVALAMSHSDAVFIGEVTDTKRKLFSYPQSWETTFAVERRWKGASSDSTPVRSNIGAAACGFKFRKPGRYLVFAHWNSRREILTTTLCDLTRLESDARELIDALDSKHASK